MICERVLRGYDHDDVILCTLYSGSIRFPRYQYDRSILHLMKMLRPNVYGIFMGITVLSNTKLKFSMISALE